MGMGSDRIGSFNLLGAPSLSLFLSLQFALGMRRMDWDAWMHGGDWVVFCRVGLDLDCVGS